MLHVWYSAGQHDTAAPRTRRSEIILYMMHDDLAQEACDEGILVYTRLGLDFYVYKNNFVNNRKVTRDTGQCVRWSKEIIGCDYGWSTRGSGPGSPS